MKLLGMQWPKNAVIRPKDSRKSVQNLHLMQFSLCSEVHSVQLLISFEGTLIISKRLGDSPKMHENSPAICTLVKRVGAVC